MKLILPKLERVLYQQKGDRNTIKQLIEPGLQLPASNVEIREDQLFVTHNGKRYCFTHREDSHRPADSMTLQTNIVPTIAKLRGGEIQAKKWLTHHDLKEWSIEEIISSWKNNFSY